jgi:subtilisin family serine protease
MTQTRIKLLLLLILGIFLTGFTPNQAKSDEEEIVVAVIDTGADLLHPDIKENLWINKGESGIDSLGRDKSKNGIDDDANGLADDFHGWNFSHHNNNLKDENGHGTHVSGIVIGLDKKRESRIRIMVLKYYDSGATGMANLLSSVRAIRYAVKMGAKIINYSGGGAFSVAEEKTAIAEAEKAGVLFVAAAGNERSNTDVYNYYPANYPLSNILSVAAHDSKGRILPSSNYGVETVDTAALGKDVFSALPHGRRGWMTGTSQATANASAVAARILLARNDLVEPRLIIDVLSRSGTYSEDLIGKTRFNTMLSAERAMQMHDLPLAQASHIKSALYTSTLD